MLINHMPTGIRTLLIGLSYIVVSLSTQSCYSFSQGAIPIHLKTVSIPIFIDKSEIPIPLLKENITEAVIQYVESGTPLIVEQAIDSDSRLGGVIKQVTDLPSGPLDDVTERSTTSRITISISFVFSDKLKDKELASEGNLSMYEEYQVNDLELREEAITIVIDKLAEEVVNRMTSKW